jgi:hypothetical protein
MGRNIFENKDARAFGDEANDDEVIVIDDDDDMVQDDNASNHEAYLSDIDDVNQDHEEPLDHVVELGDESMSDEELDEQMEDLLVEMTTERLRIWGTVKYVQENMTRYKAEGSTKDAIRCWLNATVNLHEIMILARDACNAYGRMNQRAQDCVNKAKLHLQLIEQCIVELQDGSPSPRLKPLTNSCSVGTQTDASVFHDVGTQMGASEFCDANTQTVVPRIPKVKPCASIETQTDDFVQVPFERARSVESDCLTLDNTDFLEPIEDAHVPTARMAALSMNEQGGKQKLSSKENNHGAQPLKYRRITNDRDVADSSTRGRSVLTENSSQGRGGAIPKQVKRTPLPSEIHDSTRSKVTKR